MNLTAARPAIFSEIIAPRLFQGDSGLVVWNTFRDAINWGPKERARNTSSGRRGGRGQFSVRESPAPLAVARFFSTLVPNARLEKISAKAISTRTPPSEVFTNEDTARLQMGTLATTRPGFQLVQRLAQRFGLACEQQYRWDLWNDRV